MSAEFPRDADVRVNDQKIGVFQDVYSVDAGHADLQFSQIAFLESGQACTIGPFPAPAARFAFGREHHLLVASPDADSLFEVEDSCDGSSPVIIKRHDVGATLLAGPIDIELSPTGAWGVAVTRTGNVLPMFWSDTEHDYVDGQLLQAGEFFEAGLGRSVAVGETGRVLVRTTKSYTVFGLDAGQLVATQNVPDFGLGAVSLAADESCAYFAPKSTGAPIQVLTFGDGLVQKVTLPVSSPIAVAVSCDAEAQWLLVHQDNDLLKSFRMSTSSDGGFEEVGTAVDLAAILGKSNIVIDAARCHMQ